MAGGAAEAQIDRGGEIEHHRDEALALDVAALRAARSVDLALAAERHTAVAAALLGLVQRVVGRAQQRGRGLGVTGKAGQSEADRDRHRVPGELVAEPAAEPFGQDDAVGLGGVGEDQGEFLTAHPRRDVDLARVGVDDPRDARQHGVAGLVSQPVVDLLEVIDVPGQDAHRQAAAPGPLKLEIEQLAEAAAVEQLGQRIGPRRVIQPGDQGIDARSHDPDDHRGDQQRPHRDRPPREHPGRGVRGEHEGIDDADIDDLDDRLAAVEEIGGVQEDPQVEEDQRAGPRRREVRHPADQGAARGERQRQGPGRDAPGPEDQQPRDHVGDADDHQQAELIGGWAVRQEDGEQRQRAARAEQAAQHPRHQRRLQGAVNGHRVRRRGGLGPTETGLAYLSSHESTHRPF